MDTTETCKIQWIDDAGNPTPDCNPAIGHAWMPKRTWVNPLGITVYFDESEHYPICAKHHAQMMENLETRAEWNFEPCPHTVGYSRWVTPKQSKRGSL